MNIALDQTDSLLMFLFALVLALALGVFFYLRSIRAELLVVIRRMARRCRCFGVSVSRRDRMEDLFPRDY